MTGRGLCRGRARLRRTVLDRLPYHSVRLLSTPLPFLLHSSFFDILTLVPLSLPKGISQFPLEFGETKAYPVNPTTYSNSRQATAHDMQQSVLFTSLLSKSQILQFAQKCGVGFRSAGSYEYSGKEILNDCLEMTATSGAKN